MPNRDQTGPEGLGARTGWQDGDCADSDVSGSAGVPIGRAWGWRRGRSGRRHHHMRSGFRAGRLGRISHFGRARRFGRCFRLTQEQEVEVLKDEAGWLKEQLDAVNQRLEEIKE